MSIGKIIRQLTLVLESAGLEANVTMEVILMIANLQTLGVPISLSSIPGTVSAAFGIVLIPGLGIFMDRLASSTPSKARILVFVTCLQLLGVLCVFFGNLIKLIEPDEGSGTYNMSDIFNSSVVESQVGEADSVTERAALATNSPQNDTRPWVSMGTAVQEEGIPYYAIMVMVGFACVDCGYDASSCFLKTFALACTPSEDHSSIIIKSVLVSSFGGCLMSALGSAGIGGLLTQGTSLDPNAAQTAAFSALCFFLLAAGLISTLTTGFCCPPRASKEKYRRMSESDERTPITKATVEEDLGVSSVKLSQSASGKFASPQKTKSSFVKKTATIDTLSIPEYQKGVFGFMKRHKKQIFINISTFFWLGALYSFEVYVPNFVGVSVYGGDPTARVGTDLYGRYLKGIEAGATGSLIYYVSFTVVTLFLEVALKKIGIRPIMVVSTLVLVALSLGVAISANIWLFYVTSVWMGIYRSAVITVPYVLANKFAYEQNGENASGVAISIVAAMLPLGFTLCSGLMGPLISATGNAGAPVYYTAVNAFLGTVSFAFLKFDVPG
ncbi:membrane-associated transporter protein [Aplysia californica]|uniref:Membrane-associated transporter protein n=1 Tax=Aplysia californica TaxID=6500 RepID=A0ABM1VVL7_APLCA|nr:membrane-associated transporter protein [Aplysia californica]